MTRREAVEALQGVLESGLASGAFEQNYPDDTPARADQLEHMNRVRLYSTLVYEQTA